MAWFGPMLGLLRRIAALGACGLALGCAVTPAGSHAPREATRRTDAPAPRGEPAESTRPAALPAAAEDEEPIEDGFDTAQVEDGFRPTHPLAHLTDDEITRRLTQDPESLGSMSFGRPSGGRLLNAVQLRPGEHCEVVDPTNAWGTQETVDSLIAAMEAVARKHPDTPKLSVGHISAREGGHLRPHMSHQAGRDVDISYYYSSGGHWYKRARADNLDVVRTWAFVRALVTETDVELILIDHSIQALLRRHAEAIGEDRQWLDGLFRGGGGRPSLIRHARGHGTHMHIRFYSPIAQETARRCLSPLVKHGIIDAPPNYVSHRAKKGDTLARLAKRYKTTVRAIQRANGLKSTLIQEKKRYLIPQTAARLDVPKPVSVPPRRLPPDFQPTRAQRTQ